MRDLVLMAAAPDRPELTSVSPQFRDQLPALAKSLGRARLLQWQAQLRGGEQQLRQSVQPRLWLEVLLLGLLAEPTTTAATAPVTAPSQRPVVASPAPATQPGACTPTSSGCLSSRSSDRASRRIKPSGSAASRSTSPCSGRTRASDSISITRTPESPRERSQPAGALAADSRQPGTALHTDVAVAAGPVGTHRCQPRRGAGGRQLDGDGAEPGQPAGASGGQSPRR